MGKDKKNVCMQKIIYQAGLGEVISEQQLEKQLNLEIKVKNANEKYVMGGIDQDGMCYLLFATQYAQGGIMPYSLYVGPCQNLEDKEITKIHIDFIPCIGQYSIEVMYKDQDKAWKIEMCPADNMDAVGEFGFVSLEDISNGTKKILDVLIEPKESQDTSTLVFVQ